MISNSSRGWLFGAKAAPSKLSSRPAEAAQHRVLSGMEGITGVV